MAWKRASTETNTERRRSECGQIASGLDCRQRRQAVLVAGPNAQRTRMEDRNYACRQDVGNLDWRFAGSRRRFSGRQDWKCKCCCGTKQTREVSGYALGEFQIR